MPWKLVEFIWRRKHHGDLFGGMLRTLREVTLGRLRGDPEFTEYVPYSERVVGVEEDEEQEERRPLEREDDEIVEVDRVIESDDVPFEVIPHRRQQYNFIRNVRQRRQ